LSFRGGPYQEFSRSVRLREEKEKKFVVTLFTDVTFHFLVAGGPLDQTAMGGGGGGGGESRPYPAGRPRPSPKVRKMLKTAPENTGPNSANLCLAFLFPIISFSPPVSLRGGEGGGGKLGRGRMGTFRGILDKGALILFSRRKEQRLGGGYRR